MNTILDWGTNVVIWFQQFSPALDTPFKIFTFTGDEEFFLLFLPLIYWCIDRSTGARLTVLFLLSTFFNSVAKVIADQPRPFEYNPEVKEISSASGGGFPSGHTQNALVIWSYLALIVRRTSFWIVAILLMILIPLSRIYLGVHFPTDLMGGYILGTIVLLLFLLISPRIEQIFSKFRFITGLGLTMLLPIVLIIIFPSEKDYGITACATLMGMSTGFFLERRYIGFFTEGVFWIKTVRYQIGIAVLITLWLCLKIAFSNLNPDSLFRFIRYAIVGFWGSFGAPLLFVKTGLAKNKRL